MNTDPCQQLDDYLLRDLDAEQAEAFSNHLPECESCRFAVEQQAHLDRKLKAGVEAFSCPPALVSRIRSERERRSCRRQAALGSLLAAGLVIGFLGWSLVLRTEKPAPEKKFAQRPAQPQKISVPGKSNENPPKLSQSDPVSPVRVEFSENVLGVPIETGDPDITLFQVFPISNVNADSN